MIPILFDDTETAFVSNGIGRLSDAAKCTVKEQRNGEYVLTMSYPVDGAHYSDIRNGRYIYANTSRDGNPQPFEIVQISKPMRGTVSINAEHISYRLNRIPFMPFSAQGVQNALNGFKANAAEACPFTFWTDKATASSFAVPIPASIRSYLGGRAGSILSIYGGEYEWDKWTVKLHSSRGSDTGAELRYGKNLIDLTQEENIENTNTGLCPYWYSSEGQLVTLPEKVVHADTAANFPYQRTIPMDFTDAFDNAPTEAQLRAAAQSYLVRNNYGIPKVSIKVKFIDLADTEEYRGLLSLQTVKLCDTVTVRFEKLGVNVKSKVVSTTFNVLTERYDSIEIGERRTNLATTIEDQADAIQAMPTSAQMRRSIDLATGTLNSGLRGHMIINRSREGYSNEVLFLDNENLAQARNILRINEAGIGFTDGGYYNGVYAQSWTLDGRLTLGGINNAYGNFLVLDEHAIPTVQMDKSGLRLWHTQAIGYLDNGVMYVDADHTTAITPETGAVYYDLVGGTFYIWSGTEYTPPSGNLGLNAKMTTDGIGLYRGEIDLKWNGETGIYFLAGDGSQGSTDILQIGDFIVSKAYGRQVWESSDEMTGMSGEPDEDGGYFLWAGWRSDNDFAFAVEDHGGGGADRTIVNGSLYVNGVDVMQYIANMSAAEDEETEDGEQYEGITIDLDSPPEPEPTGGA